MSIICLICTCVDWPIGLGDEFGSKHAQVWAAWLHHGSVHSAAGVQWAGTVDKIAGTAWVYVDAHTHTHTRSADWLVLSQKSVSLVYDVLCCMIIHENKNSPWDTDWAWWYVRRWCWLSALLSVHLWLLTVDSPMSAHAETRQLQSHPHVSEICSRVLL